MSVCLDSWVILEWLHGKEPSLTRVDELVEDGPVVSWVNLVEVHYRLERDYGRDRADIDLADLRSTLVPDLPGTARMIDAARLKAKHPIALGDCFALATAAAHGLTLWTGDPEILGLEDPPCEIEDLRAVG